MRFNIVYKVVYVSDGVYHSTNMQHHNSWNRIDAAFDLKYEVGKLTKPKIGKIFVFQDEAVARRYALSLCGPMKVMKGIAVNVTKAEFPNVLSMTYHRTEASMRNFWHGDLSKRIKSDGGGGWETPNNTYLCDSFKPLEVLK